MCSVHVLIHSYITLPLQQYMLEWPIKVTVPAVPFHIPAWLEIPNMFLCYRKSFYGQWVPFADDTLRQLVLPTGTRRLLKPENTDKV